MFTLSRDPYSFDHQRVFDLSILHVRTDSERRASLIVDTASINDQAARRALTRDPSSHRTTTTPGQHHEMSETISRACILSGYAPFGGERRERCPE